VIAN